MSLQEKFQITIPAKEMAPKRGEEWDNWTESGNQAKHRDLHGRAAVKEFSRLNQIPKINLVDSVTNDMPLVTAGQSDVSDHVTGSYERGFAKLEMAATDDQYTGEHTDLFYGDSGGFVERNNYLDRA